jgi:hypothetical protein
MGAALVRDGSVWAARQKNASIFIAGRRWLPTTYASGSTLYVQEQSKESPTRATECSVLLKSQTTNEFAVAA